MPRFEVRVTGPDHEPVFSAEVYAGDHLLVSTRTASGGLVVWVFFGPAPTVFERCS